MHESNNQATSGQVMGAARMRGIVAGRKLATDGTPIMCAGGKPLEVFSFLMGAAEGHSEAMAQQVRKIANEYMQLTGGKNCEACDE